MTDEISRAEFKELKARVRRLEHELEQSDGNPTANIGTDESGPSGARLDRYDRPVVSTLEHGEEYTTPELAKRYRSQTTIQQQKTAKQRARSLVEKEFFKDGYGHSYIYRG